VQAWVSGASPALPGLGASSLGVVTLSQTERNLPTIANVDARDFKDLACWLIVQIGPISLNVTTPRGEGPVARGDLVGTGPSLAAFLCMARETRDQKEQVP
jgi:hypothetical protein